MIHHRRYRFFLACLSFVSLPGFCLAAASAVFIHPDGTGLGHWNAARYYHAGPDGMLNWDLMERLAAYRVHQKNWLSTNSHSGATTHAYGKKVHYNSFGLDRDQPITALSGKNLTIMEEAIREGLRVGIVNSGHVGEPGTAVFLSRSESRGAVCDIAAQVFSSGADLVFCGGEIFLIPEGTVGRHGREGVRTDNRDLLSEARAGGYTVVHTREELLKLPPETEKVIGVFAAEDTYNDRKETDLKAAGLELYDPAAPSLDEMVEMAMRILGNDPAREFLLVAEEEGTDNFSNKNNAGGMLEALGRADRAIGKVLHYMDTHPFRNILLLVGSDSDAGHPGIWGPLEWDEDYLLPETSASGAELDGPDGQGGRPFWTKADQFGNRHPFGIAWGTVGDFPGSDVTKAHGYRSDLLKASIDNTDIYRILYEVLFRP